MTPPQGLKSSGGFVWACKNYDGDVQSDIVAQVRPLLLVAGCIQRHSWPSCLPAWLACALRSSNSRTGPMKLFAALLALQ